MCAASGGPVRFITVTVYAMLLPVSSYSKVAAPPAPGNVPVGDGTSSAASSVASSVTFGSSWAACPADTNDNENASTIGAARCRITAPPVGLGSLPAFEPSRAGDPRERRAHGDRQRVPGEQVEPLVDWARDPHRERHCPSAAGPGNRGAQRHRRRRRPGSDQRSHLEQEERLTKVSAEVLTQTELDGEAERQGLQDEPHGQSRVG